MEIIEDNLHPKVLKNRLFINAIDYLIEQNVVEDQKGVSARTGITEATLSNIRNDKKIVSDRTIRKFLEGFPNIFNPTYFKGDNIYMTLKESLEAKMYEEEQKLKEKEMQTPQALDYTFLIEKAVEKATAYADKMIANLEKQVADKDQHISILKKHVAEKNQQIANLQAQLRELETYINNHNIENPLEKHPFPVGVADDGSVHILIDKV